MAITIRLFVVPIEEESEDELDGFDLTIYEKMLILIYLNNFSSSNLLF